GDKAARDKLIEHNLRLVAHIVKKYSNYRKESEDLISVGTIGLIKAVCTFKSEKGSKLGTYAARCIENEILMCLRAQKKHLSDISLQETVGVDKDGGGILLQDKIADSAKSVEDSIEEKIQLRQVSQKMKELLTERERLIINLRYGLETGKEVTQREIAKMLGISRSYVSRIETAALKKIRNGLTE
ncbi:MAG: RNA polymerase sporulation sigma factor SigK, partial [Firmicutes bacterium]|nr:RNA polymerase sporulation sigma factor SigK [Bacillota bacterium]